MKRAVVFLGLIILFAGDFFSTNPLVPKNVSKDPKTILSGVPAFVTQNKGQWMNDILFRGTADQGIVRFLKNGISYAVVRTADTAASDPAKHVSFLNLKCLVWNQKFIGYDQNVKVVGEQRTGSVSNYFYGKDKITGVPDYSVVNYKNIYPDVDVKYYTVDNNLKYDLILHKGADVNSIKIAVEGVTGVDVDRNGDLVMHTVWGDFKERIPYSYQNINGIKTSVQVSFIKISETQYGFKINGQYNKNTDLVIDPIAIDWGTYVGSSAGNGTQGGRYFDMAVDANKNVYVVGYSSDGTWPTTAGVYDSSFNGKQSNGDVFAGLNSVGWGDAVLFKINSTGSTLVASTYIGGSASETARMVHVNGIGEVIISGVTISKNFPVTSGAADTVWNQPASPGSISDSVDCFITKFNSSINSLVYSTYLGGKGYDFLLGMDVNALDEVFVTGFTRSADFPTTVGAFQTTTNIFGFERSVFVTKLNTDGKSLAYSTYVGGAGGSDNTGHAIALDDSSNAYVTGMSQGFSPTQHIKTTVNAYDTTLSGQSDAFVFKLSPDGSQLKYSTLIGGSAYENIYGGAGVFPFDYFAWGCGIDVTKNGEAVIGGYTTSTDFPATTGVVQPAISGNLDGIVAKFTPAGDTLVFSTYLGGASQEWVTDLTLNDDGDIWVSGTGYYSAAFATCSMVSVSLSSQWPGSSKYFMVKLDSIGTKKLYAAYLGGTFSEYPEGSIVSMGSGCNEEIWGSWSSDSFFAPTTTGSYKKNKTSVPYAGQTEAVVFHIKPKLTASFTKTASVCQSPITFTADTVVNNPTCLWEPVAYYAWNYGDGSLDSGKVVSHTYNYAGTYTVTLTVGCPDASTTQTVALTTAMTGTITATDKTCDANGTASITMAGGTTPYTYLWSNGGTSSSISDLDSGTYKVDVLDAANACYYSASVMVADSAIDCRDSIFIPNVFTPNGDGKNDKWIISQFKYKEIKAVVYDRWGLKMAEWNSLNGGWEGRNGSGKECPDGTYYYIVTATNSKDEQKEYTGFLQLLREGK